MTEVRIRDFDPRLDESFILNSWMKSYIYNRVRSWRHVSIERAEAGHRPVVERLMRDAPIRCAVDPESPATIWGWACTEGPCLHFVYVKKKFRNKGIATALLSDAGEPTLYSHITAKSTRGYLWFRRREMQYSPAHAHYPKETNEHPNQAA